MSGEHSKRNLASDLICGGEATEGVEYLFALHLEALLSAWKQM